VVTGEATAGIIFDVREQSAQNKVVSKTEKYRNDSYRHAISIATKRVLKSVDSKGGDIGFGALHFRSSGLRRRDAVQSGVKLQTFRRDLLPPFSSYNIL
jgi:hypothetical protein